MRAYIVRRILILIPTMLLVSFIVFFVVRLIPGDIIDAMLAQPGAADSVIDRAALEKKHGLDAPALVQYGRWMGFLPQRDGKFHGIFQGYLGQSFWQRDSVIKMVGRAWPVTLELGLIGIVIAQLIALPIGVYSAVRQDTLGDYLGRTFAILCISVPGFWLGTLIIVFPAVWWNHMPSLFLIRFSEDPLGNLGMFIVPAFILGMAMAGGTMRMTRTMMLEVLRQDYIRTAWSKGLRERVVIMRHALKNALIPVVTIVGLQLPLLIGGTVIIENIFNLGGMGRLIVEATANRDEMLISGVLVIFGFGVMIINLLVDLTYAYLDPRIHYG